MGSLFDDGPQDNGINPTGLGFSWWWVALTLLCLAPFTAAVIWG